MKENIIKTMKRIVTCQILVFMTASVFLKLIENMESWLIGAILRTASSTLAQVIRSYWILKNKRNQSNIINFKTKKREDKKLKWYEVFGDTIIVTLVIGITYCFIIGVLLEAKEWKFIVGNMIIFFAITYFVSYYLEE